MQSLVFKNRFLPILGLLASVLFSNSLLAGLNSDDEPLNLAALLISDGNLNRAQLVLDAVDVNNTATDLPQYYLLTGLLAFKNQQYQQAVDGYELSVNAGQKDPLIHVYLAQAHYSLLNYQLALTAISAYEQALQSQAQQNQQQYLGFPQPSIYALQAQCFWQLKMMNQAWQALDNGNALFSHDSRFDRQKIYYLIEQGLFQQAIEIAEHFLKGNDATDKEYIALGRALRESGQFYLAEQVLEKAKLLFPQSAAVMTELAHVYLKEEKSTVASDLFYQAWVIEPKLAADTAELYRQSGRLYRALNINSEIIDQKAKLKQRLAILIELGDFESVAAMNDAMNRLQLFENQDLRYAHAYALFRTGDFAFAKQQLSQLTRADLFRKATELRKAMDTCEGAAWLCY